MIINEINILFSQIKFIWNMWIYIHTHTNTHTHIYGHYLSFFVYIGMYVCIYIYTHIYIYIYCVCVCVLREGEIQTMARRKICVLNYITVCGKGKTVLLQACRGPEGSRKLRFQHFKTTAQDGGKVVSLTHRPPLPPGNTPGTHFC